MVDDLVRDKENFVFVLYVNDLNDWEWNRNVLCKWKGLWQRKWLEEL